MRTTIRLDDQLLREAKGVAAASGKSLAALIEDALRESPARRQAPARGEPIALSTFKGHGLRPGVDLDDSAALLELMDTSDAASGW